jgi:hypothetical protein
VIRRDALSAGVLALGLVVIAGTAVTLRSTFVGDAAIYLPYARNIADGNLFQFNPGGEFSSGSTSPLWAALLALPYLLGGGIAGAKTFAALGAAGAFLVTVGAVARLTGARVAAAFAGFFVIATTAVLAVSLYESALVVALSALALLGGDAVLQRWRVEGTPRPRDLMALGAVWAALPLARPDAALLVALQFGVLWAAAPDRRVRAALPLIAAATVAAVPAALYFGYSLLELGVLSTSSDGRAFALREATQTRIGPFFLSPDAARFLWGEPAVYAVVPALVGLWLFARDAGRRWLAVYGFGALAGYFALLTFVAPGNVDTPRYFAPVAPVIVLGLARALREPRDPRLWALGLILAAVFVVRPGVNELLVRSTEISRWGLTEEEVLERDVIEQINRLARPGDVVLSYEVQSRYHLRDDVRILSLDGIIDAKVGPYRASGDMVGFLYAYRPRFWIADENVFFRPFLRRGVLNRVYRELQADPQQRVATAAGITFTVLSRRARPLNEHFGGWTMLVELSYGDARADAQ